MALPNSVRKRIIDEATKYAHDKIENNDYVDNALCSYADGATAVEERAQPVIDAFEALLNMMPKGDALRYFHAKEEVIKGRQLLQQWKGEKEVGDG